MAWGDKDNVALINNLQLLQNKAAKLILDRPLYSSARRHLVNSAGWLFHTIAPMFINPLMEELPIV